jgi:hypothetical protein
MIQIFFRYLRSLSDYFAKYFAYDMKGFDCDIFYVQDEVCALVTL